MLITLLRLPFLPVQAVVKLAEVIADEADRQAHSPAAVRRRLEDAAEARAAGTMSAQEYAEAEREAAAALVVSRPRAQTEEEL